jgi:CxxC motif-containing protein
MENNMPEEKREFVCISCPRGCEITTVLDGKSIVSVSGNICHLGVKYVEDEVTDPRRVVTSTVRVRGGSSPLAPVWTEQSIPKGMILRLADELRKVEMTAPVKCGDMVLEDVFGTGINVVASGEVEVK